jgi:tetratricopeptide (TPR) repeat protein
VPSFLAETSRLGADPASAARWYKAALRAQPDHVATLNNLALALGQLKDPAAIGYAQKALKLAPNHPAVLDTAGWLQVQEGNLDGGLPLLEQAHALAPASAEIQLNLAKALLKAGTMPARISRRSTACRRPLRCARKPRGCWQPAEIFIHSSTIDPCIPSL